jgi:hypothetical protein
MICYRCATSYADSTAAGAAAATKKLMAFNAVDWLSQAQLEPLALQQLGICGISLELLTLRMTTYKAVVGGVVV